jgi:oligoendopeptidase F
MNIALPENPDQRWDLTAFFPNVDGPEFRGFMEGLSAATAEFDRSFDTTAGSNRFAVDQWAELFAMLERIEARRDHLAAYVQFSRAEDPADSTTARAELEYRSVNAAIKVARSRLLLAFRSLSEDSRNSLYAHPSLKDARLALDMMFFDAQHVLPQGEEAIVHTLALEGLHRWSSLAASTLITATIPIHWPSGECEDVPLAQRYELLWHPSTTVRREAFDGINREMERQSELLAHCINAVGGFELSVAKFRNADMVETAIRQNGVQAATVETMMASVRRFAPRLHKYLQLKTGLLGLDWLGIQDRSAPLPAKELESFTYSEAREQILSALRRVSGGLEKHAEDLFRSRHIEAILSPGRQSGGFCMSSPIARQSRVFVNYGGSFNGVATLAHEIGHAFHGHANFGLRPWRQLPPSTLCETAAILYEHVLRRAVYHDKAASMEARRSALAAHLDAAVNYLLRLPRDFEFEKRFLDRRKDGDMNPAQLCEMMKAGHQDWFGTAFRNDGGDQWGWAYNRFLMDPDLRLYNFPYTFAFVLSSRIADRFESEGDAFLETYCAFLNASGSMPVEEAVCTTLGYDIAQDAFWDETLAGIASDIDFLETI